MVQKYLNIRDYKDLNYRGSHAQDVYPTQNILRTGTEREKQEQRYGTRIIEKDEINLEEWNFGSISVRVPNKVNLTLRCYKSSHNERYSYRRSL